MAPLIVRSVIVSEIHSLLGLDATLDDVDINPFALTCDWRSSRLPMQKKAPLVAFDELDATRSCRGIVNRALTLVNCESCTRSFASNATRRTE